MPTSKIIRIFIFVISHLLFVSSKSVAKSSEISGQIAWLAFGDLRGYLEPCGCNPQTDLGGIARLAQFLDRERRLTNNKFHVFDLGNTAPPVLKGDAHKIEFLYEAIGSLRPNASLVNVLELQRWDEVKKLISPHKWYVLSNNSKKMIDVQRFIESEDAYIFGYTFDNKIKNYVESYSSKILNDWKRNAKNKNKKRVLLFSGSQSDLEAIVAAQFFDIIISSNKASFDIEPGTEEREKPGTLLRMGYRNDAIYMVPIAGTGVLRGGTMRSASAAKVIADLKRDCLPQSNLPFTSIECPEEGEPRSRLMGLSQQLFTWLDVSYKSDTHMRDIMSRYDERARNIFLATINQRTENLKNSPFAGSEACKSCHAEAHKIWEQSKHAKAFVILQKKGKDNDPECVSCHVLGFKDEGGFVSFDISPQFAHVNCENCHGPRKDHVANPAIKSTKDAKASCIGCHYNPHSSNFIYEEYWKKIEHK